MIAGCYMFTDVMHVFVSDDSVYALKVIARDTFDTPLGCYTAAHTSAVSPWGTLCRWLTHVTRQNLSTLILACVLVTDGRLVGRQY